MAVDPQAQPESTGEGDRIPVRLPADATVEFGNIWGRGTTLGDMRGTTSGTGNDIYGTDGRTIRLAQRVTSDVLPWNPDRTQEIVDATISNLQVTGRNPRDVVLDSVRNNTVTLLGEMHTMAAMGSHKQLMSSLFQDLPSGTKFAIEIPSLLKPALDHFSRTGELRIPDDFPAQYREQAQRVLQEKLFNVPGMMDILHSARRAGVEICPIDNNYALANSPAEEAQLWNERDAHMRDQLLALTPDKNSRVIGFFGAQHVAHERHATLTSDSALQLFKTSPEFQQRGLSVASFYGVIPEEVMVRSPLTNVLNGIDRPLAAAVTDSTGQMTHWGRMIATTPLLEGEDRNRMQGANARFGMFDGVFFYPPAALNTARLDPIARMTVGKPENLAVPKLPTDDGSVSRDQPYWNAETALAVRNEVNATQMAFEAGITQIANDARVIGVSRPKMELYQHVNFATTLMRGLKAGGATHAAFTIPESLNDKMAEFNRTRKVDLDLVRSGQITEGDAALMQAALLNGMDLVALGRPSGLGNDSAEAQAERVQALLTANPRAKVALIADERELSNINDERDTPSLLSRLRPLGAKSVLTSNDTVQTGGTRLSLILQNPVLIPTPANGRLGALPADRDFVSASHPTMSAWDYYLAHPFFH